MKITFLIFSILLSHISAYALVGGTPLPNAEEIFPLNMKNINANSPGQFFSSNGVGFIKIGERTLITCGHCVNWQTTWGIQVEGDPFLALGFDGNSTLVNGIENKTVPALEYMVSADQLPQDYQTPPPHPVHRLSEAALPNDVAVMVIPKSFPLSDDFKNMKPLSISKVSPQEADDVYFAGNGVTLGKDQDGNEGCYGDKTWNYGMLKVTDVASAYFSVNGKGMGVNGQPNAYTCPGDSGGLFFQVSTDGSISLFGLTSQGNSTVEILPTPKYLIETTIPAFSTAGVNLSSPQVREWLQKIATEHDEKICGINTECDLRKWNVK